MKVSLISVVQIDENLPFFAKVCARLGSVSVHFCEISGSECNEINVSNTIFCQKDIL